MNTRKVFSLSASALLLGGTMVGCAGGDAGIASASDRSAAATARTAARDAAKGSKALHDHDTGTAIASAEAAVALAPRNAEYRVLLGQSYLQGGRFLSAREAFGDALVLTPDNGKAALNLALAQIGTGDWSGARKTLGDHPSTIAPADRGLAMALAGDPTGAVTVLTDAARSGTSNVTIRQNLALSYALAGEWRAARVVASADMSPADVDARMEKWAAFAHPTSASDQVASLLGVQPIADGGQPVALALNAAVPSAPAAVAEAPVNTAELSPEAAPPSASGRAEGQVPRVLAEQQVSPSVAAAPMPRATIAATPVKLAVPAGTERPAHVAPTLRPASTPMKIALASKREVTKTSRKRSWFVQIGAFESAGVAKDAWGRAVRRMPVLSSHGPSGMHFATKAGQFYRLSVGGFARTDAVQLCQRYRATGGACFVRAGAGDQTAQWLRKSTVQLAAR